ncbi:MAG: hypothetical protein PVJ15_00945 [Gammaproteobacteria bacterium]|jgi:hypothetical protein
MKSCLRLLLAVFVGSLPLSGYCGDRGQPPGGDTAWVTVTPLAVSTAAFESPSNIHCHMGLAYEISGTRYAGAAMTRHCLNLVAVAARVQAEIADADSEAIRLVIDPEATDYYRRIRHILVDGIDYDLSE